VRRKSGRLTTAPARSRQKEKREEKERCGTIEAAGETGSERPTRSERIRLFDLIPRWRTAPFDAADAVSHRSVLLLLHCHCPRLACACERARVCNSRSVFGRSTFGLRRAEAQSKPLQRGKFALAAQRTDAWKPTGVVIPACQTHSGLMPLAGWDEANYYIWPISYSCKTHSLAIKWTANCTCIKTSLAALCARSETQLL
jgi:hypothetical protein